MQVSYLNPKVSRIHSSDTQYIYNMYILMSYLDLNMGDSDDGKSKLCKVFLITKNIQALIINYVTYDHLLSFSGVR